MGDLRWGSGSLVQQRRVGASAVVHRDLPDAGRRAARASQDRLKLCGSIGATSFPSGRWWVVSQLRETAEAVLKVAPSVRVLDAAV